MTEALKRKKAKRILAFAIVAVVIAFLAISIGGGQYLVTYSIGRRGGGGDRQVALSVDEKEVAKTASEVEKNAAIQKELNEQFKKDVKKQSVKILSDDGLSLNAGYFAQPESHRWAIVVHGYRGRHDHMISYAQRYYDAGYQVLAPDLRACGESEGDYVGMGWPDHLDMLRWMDWILANDPEAQIVMHGVSMGAATVMMTSGESVPEQLVAFVEDCGYTSVWDIFASELGLRFHLPTFPLLNSASVLAKLEANYSFSEASSLNQIRNCDKPMLFIHGDQDNFVPFEMEQVLYDAKPGDNKQLVAVQGAGHGYASTVLGDQYWETVFNFIDQYD